MGWNQMDKFKCNYNGMEKSFQNAAQMPRLRRVRRALAFPTGKVCVQRVGWRCEILNAKAGGIQQFRIFHFPA